ncbi:MAG: YbjN domain-containing protein [Bacteroidota bacterium]
MRKLILNTTLTILSLIVFSTTAQAQWTESQLQKMYLDYLETKGITGSVDSDGDVAFNYEDHSYFIEVNEGDNEFFRVVLPNIWPIESVQEGLQVVQACDAVNRSMKCTKAYVTNDDVWIAVELFLGSPDDFKSVFDRCMQAIERGLETFVEEM